MKQLSRTILLLTLAACIMVACSSGSGDRELSGECAYCEQYRPAFHFSPDSMWTNDPNGLVYYAGEYHLFFQHHPSGNTWGPMHWGHAVSTDLIHWKQLPIALYPDSLGYIFSGSAVIDRANSSGFGTAEHPPMIAIFTHHNPELETSGSITFQNQSIAYSTDRGRSWTKYEGNPVLVNPGIRDFRDPKVIRYEPGGNWIMVLAAYDRVMFYSSPDLIHWSYESEFGENKGAHGGVWECPDLLPLEVEGATKWVLLVSINPGGPNGGSGTQYFVGEFDGSKFICENCNGLPLWIDYGKDNYAGVTWSGIPKEDGRKIFLGWMSNWQYANQVPTRRWRNAMTIPRELTLRKQNGLIRLNTLPVRETVILRESGHSLEPRKITEKVEIISPGDAGQGLLELELLFHPAEGITPEETDNFGILLCNLRDTLGVDFDLRNQEVIIDRRRSGIDDFSPDFPGSHRAPLKTDKEGSIRLHAFIDRSSIELFINGGTCVMTEIFFPEQPYEQVLVYADGIPVELVSGSFHTLKNIWKQ